MAEQVCAQCDEPIGDSARRCPHCRAWTNGRLIGDRRVRALIVAVMMLGAVAWFTHTNSQAQKDACEFVQGVVHYPDREC